MNVTHRTNYYVDMKMNSKQSLASIKKLNKTMTDFAKTNEKQLKVMMDTMKGIGGITKKVTQEATKHNKVVSDTVKVEAKELAIKKQMAKIDADTKDTAALVNKLGTKELYTAHDISIAELKIKKERLESLAVNQKDVKLSITKNSIAKIELDILKKQTAERIRQANVKDHRSLADTTSRALTTIPAFYAVFAGMQAVSTAFTSVMDNAIRFDATMRTLSAVTDASITQTRQLTKEVFNLGNVYGGSIEDIANTSTELARAGINMKDLVKATEVTSKLALITNDTIQSAANAVISYSQVYQKANGKAVYSTEQLGDKLAYMANASRLATTDIGILSNYALASAKSVGLTIDQVNGLAISFSNAGNNASTIGTQIRRFTNTLHSNSTAVKEFYKSVGVNRTSLLIGLESSKDGTADGIKKSNDAFTGFVRNVQKLSNSDYRNAIEGMNVLDNQFFNQLRNNGDEIIGALTKSFSGLNGELDKTVIIADSLEKRWDKLGNRFTNTFSDAGGGLASFTLSLGEGYADAIAHIFSGFDDSLGSSIEKIRKANTDLRNIMGIAKDKFSGLSEKDFEKGSEALRRQLSLTVQIGEIEKQIFYTKEAGEKVSSNTTNKLKELQIQKVSQEAIVKLYETEENVGLRIHQIRKITARTEQLIKDIRTDTTGADTTALEIAKNKELMELITAYNLAKKEDEITGRNTVEVARLAVTEAARGLTIQKANQEAVADVLGVEKERLSVILKTKTLGKEELRTLKAYAKTIQGLSTSFDSSTFTDFLATTTSQLQYQQDAIVGYQVDLNNTVEAYKEFNKVKLDASSLEQLRQEGIELTKHNKFKEAGVKFAKAEADAILLQVKADVRRKDINKILSAGKIEGVELSKQQVSVLENELNSLDSVLDVISKVIESSGIQLQVFNSITDTVKTINTNLDGTQSVLQRNTQEAYRFQNAMSNVLSAINAVNRQMGVLSGTMSSEVVNIQDAQERVKLAKQLTAQAKERASLALFEAPDSDDSTVSTKRRQLATKEIQESLKAKQEAILKEKEAVLNLGKTKQRIAVQEIDATLQLRQAQLRNSNAAKTYTDEQLKHKKNVIDRLSTEKQALVLQREALVTKQKEYGTHVDSLALTKYETDLLNLNTAINSKQLAIQKAGVVTKTKSSKAAKSALSSAKKHNRVITQTALTELDIEQLKAKQEVLQASIDAGGTAQLTKKQKLVREQKLLNLELIKQNKLIKIAQATKDNAKGIQNVLKASKDLEVLKVKRLDIIDKQVNLDAKLDIQVEVSSLQEAIAQIFDPNNNTGLANSLNKYGDIIGSSLNSFISAIKSGDVLGASAAIGDGLVSAGKASGNPYLVAASYGAELLGALFSDALSEVEIEAATGRSEFESKSLENQATLYEKYQAPQLVIANRQLDSLDKLNEKFGAVALALSGSGLGLDGGNFTATSDIGFLGFNASSTELLGAGIQFGEQAIGALQNGLDVVGYESIKKKSSSLWGLISHESIVENSTDLSEKIKGDLTTIIQDSFDLVSTNLEVLGFDVEAFNQALSNEVIKIGKINFKDMNAEEKQIALQGAISEMLDKATTGALSNMGSDPELLANLENMQRVDEELTSTIARISVGYETVNTQLAMFGQEIDSFVQSQALIDAAGGLEVFNSAMKTFVSSFFTSEEQHEMQELQLQMALQTHDIALPATKAQFKALVLETEQRIISIKAQLEVIKARARMEGQAGIGELKYLQEVEKFKQLIYTQAANGNLKFIKELEEIKTDLTAKGGEVTIDAIYQEYLARHAAAQGITDVNNYVIGSNGELIKSQNTAGQASIAYGENVRSGVDAMLGQAHDYAEAIKNGGEVTTAQLEAIQKIEVTPPEVNWDNFHTPEFDALNVELANLESLYGTLMQNMGDFADYYTEGESLQVEAAKAAADAAKESADIRADADKEAEDAAKAAADAISELASRLLAIADFKAQLTGDDRESAKIVLDATTIDTGLVDVTLDNILTKFNALGKDATREQIADYNAQWKALQGVDNANKAYLQTLEANQTSILNLQNAWGDNTALKVAQVELDFAQRKTGLIGLSASNYYEKLNIAVADGMNEETIKDWEKMSSAIKKVTDIENKAIEDSLTSTKDFYTNVLDTMIDLNSNLVSDVLKLEDIKTREQKALDTGDIKGYLSLIKEDNKQYKEQSATRADYEYYTRKQLVALEKLEPPEEDATTKDVVDGIDAMKKEIIELRREISDMKRTGT